MDKHTCYEQAYKNGYAQGKQDATQWIPIADRLPEPYTIVFIWDNTNKRVTDAYMTRNKVWVGISMSYEVTHWLPMPEPPKGE